MPQSPRATRLYGCGTIAFTLGVMCVLLLVNSLATAAIYKLLTELSSWIVQQPQRSQAFLLVTTLVLMVFEWWTIDLIVDILATARQERERRKADHLTNGARSDVHNS